MEMSITKGKNYIHIKLTFYLFSVR